MSTSEENHPPASPPQAEDPPETAASIVMTIHPEALSCTPPLPDLPPLDVLLQTQEWSTTTIDDEDNTAPHDTPIQEEARPLFKIKRMRVSFAYKGFRLSALKAFFLTNFQEELSSRIPDDVFLDGIIISTPRKGKSDAYHMKWNASTLAVVVNESKLRTVVSKDDHVFISQLKVARVAFDEYYPNGPPTSVVSLIHRKKKESNKISKMQHQASNPKKKRKVVPAEQEVPTSQVAASSRSITILRMAPIFASMTEAHNNQTVDNNSPNDNDSDPDDELLEFTADITEDYNNIEPLHVCNKFISLLATCGVAGGFTYELIKRITANSNAYANSRKKNNRFGGNVWKPIIVEEMYHFLGMTLKMSIENRDLGGLAAYFCPPNEMKCGPDRSIQIYGFSSWAAEIIPLYGLNLVTPHRSSPGPGGLQNLTSDSQVSLFIFLF